MKENFPYIQIYPGDFYRSYMDIATAEETNFWIRVKFLMNDTERRGYLIEAGAPIQLETIALKLRIPLSLCDSLFSKLLAKEVFLKSSDGLIFDPEMVERDKKRMEERIKKRKQRRRKNVPELSPGMSLECPLEYDYDNSVNQDTSFDDFWELYPKRKRKAKLNAEKSWRAIKPDKALFDKIKSALKAQTSSEEWQKDNGQFIPLPATWLNGRRWEDEVYSPSKNSVDIQAMRAEKWAAAGKSRCHGSTISDGRCDSCLQMQVQLKLRGLTP